MSVIKLQKVLKAKNFMQNFMHMGISLEKGQPILRFSEVSMSQHVFKSAIIRAGAKCPYLFPIVQMSYVQ